MHVNHVTENFTLLGKNVGLVKALQFTDVIGKTNFKKSKNGLLIFEFMLINFKIRPKSVVLWFYGFFFEEPDISKKKKRLSWSNFLC